MSYTINVRVINDTTDTLTLVEKTVWYFANGGTWTESSSDNIVTMGGSGTSGMLRFKSSNGETIGVLVGVHNYKRWCDIVTDIQSAGTDKSTCMYIHPTYYQSGTPGSATREKQLADMTKITTKGRRLTVHFYVDDGSNLYCVFTYS